MNLELKHLLFKSQISKDFLRAFGLCVLILFSGSQAIGQSQADLTIQSVRERLRKLKAQQDGSQESSQPVSGVDSVTSHTTGTEPGTKAEAGTEVVQAVEIKNAEIKNAEIKSVETKSDEGKNAESKKEEIGNVKIKNAIQKESQTASSNVQIDVPGVSIAKPEVKDSEDSIHMFGDWAGRREKWASRGFDLEVVYRGEGNRNLSGGLRQRTVLLGGLDIKMIVDGERVWNKKGLTIFVNGVSAHGADNDNSPSKNVGDIQGTSNIETPVNLTKLYEASVEKTFYEDRLSFLFGLHDLGSEFYVTESSAQFLNRSLGVGREFSQTGVNGPSLSPTTALALRAKVTINERFDFQVAGFGAQAGDPDHPAAFVIRSQPSDGLLWIGELIAKDPVKIRNSRTGKISLGVWKYSGTFPHLSETSVNEYGVSGPTRAGNSGLYGLWNQTLDSQRSFFVHSGWASTAVNQTRSSLAFGLVKRGSVKRRPKDSIGLGFTRAMLGSTAQEARAQVGLGTSAAETTVELYYRFELKPGVAIQPDLQWVDHPSQDPPTNNAIVAALRAELNF